MSGPVSTADAGPPEPAHDLDHDRTVEITPARTATVGSSSVQRLLPRRARRTVGAWCFLDHFGPHPNTPERAMRVGPHPHIGLQTVTWLLAGEVLHTDSLGSEQPIRPGQLNLMTAGHGVAHAEDSRHVSGGDLHGVQLWVAQPDGTRDGPPAFEHHAELPSATFGGATATVLVGELDRVSSPARTDTPLLGVDLVVRGSATIPVQPDHEHALVVLSGSLEVGGTPVGTDELAYLGCQRDEIGLVAFEPSRVLLLGGEPCDDDLLMWWNFVARSRDEVDDAVGDWESGHPRFGAVRTTLDRIPAPPRPWHPDGDGAR